MSGPFDHRARFRSQQVAEAAEVVEHATAALEAAIIAVHEAHPKWTRQQVDLEVDRLQSELRFRARFAKVAAAQTEAEARW
jgi:hypothetical protein